MNRYTLSLSLLLAVPAGLLADGACLDKQLDCLLRHQQAESKRQADIEGVVKYVVGSSVAASMAQADKAPVNHVKTCANLMGRAIKRMGVMEVCGNHAPDLLKREVNVNLLGNEVCLYDENMGLQVVYAVVEQLLANQSSAEAVRAGVLAAAGERVLALCEKLLSGLCGGPVPIVGQNGDKYVRACAQEGARDYIHGLLSRVFAGFGL